MLEPVVVGISPDDLALCIDPVRSREGGTEIKRPDAGCGQQETVRDAIRGVVPSDDVTVVVDSVRKGGDRAGDADAAKLIPAEEIAVGDPVGDVLSKDVAM